MQRHSALARYAHAIALLIAIAVGAVQAETLHLDCSPAKADGFVLQDTLANYGELREVSERAYVNMVLQEQYPSIPVGYETCPIGSEYTLTPYNACIKFKEGGVPDVYVVSFFVVVTCGEYLLTGSMMVNAQYDAGLGATFTRNFKFDGWWVEPRWKPTLSPSMPNTPTAEDVASPSPMDATPPTVFASPIAPQSPIATGPSPTMGPSPATAATPSPSPAMPSPSTAMPSPSTAMPSPSPAAPPTLPAAPLPTSSPMPTMAPASTWGPSPADEDLESTYAPATGPTAYQPPVAVDLLTAAPAPAPEQNSTAPATAPAPAQAEGVVLFDTDAPSPDAGPEEEEVDDVVPLDRDAAAPAPAEPEEDDHVVDDAEAPSPDDAPAVDDTDDQPAPDQSPRPNGPWTAPLAAWPPATPPTVAVRPALQPPSPMTDMQDAMDSPSSPVYAPPSVVRGPGTPPTVNVAPLDSTPSPEVVSWPLQCALLPGFQRSDPLNHNTTVAARYAWERRLAAMGPRPPSPCDPMAATLAIQEACAHDLVVGYATAMRFVVALDCAVSSVVEVHMLIYSSPAAPGGFDVLVRNISQSAWSTGTTNAPVLPVAVRGAQPPAPAAVLVAPRPVPSPSPAASAILIPRACEFGRPQCRFMLEDVTCCSSGALTTSQPHVHMRLVCSELTYVPESRCLVVDGPRNATAMVAEFGYLLESRRFLLRWESGYRGAVTVSLNQTGEGCTLPLQAPCSDQGVLYSTMPAVKPLVVTANPALSMQGEVDTLAWANGSTCAMQEEALLPRMFYMREWLTYGGGVQREC